MENFVASFAYFPGFSSNLFLQLAVQK